MTRDPARPEPVVFGTVDPRSPIALTATETYFVAVGSGRAGYDRIDRYDDNPFAHHWFAKAVGSPAPK